MKFKTKQELLDAIKAYADYCELNSKPMTIAGLSYFTGITRQTIYNYESRDEFKPVIEDMRNRILMNLEELLLTKNNVGGVIFLLKQHGYADTSSSMLGNPLEVNVVWAD